MLSTRFFSLCVSWILCAGLSPAHAQQQWHLSPVNGHWYTTIDHVGLTWCALENAAAATGGFLACVRSQAEQDWALTLVPPNINFIAIGGSDAQQEGVWRWSNGEPFALYPMLPQGWNPWNPGEPNNGPSAGQGLEHHAYLERTSSWRWNDACGCCGPIADARVGLVEMISGDCNLNGIPDAYEIRVGQGTDSNGDGILDSCQIKYADVDGDGFGGANVVCSASLPCTLPGVYTTGDCDDTRANVYPGAPELCDGLDNDCDGAVDEGFMSTYCTAGTTINGCLPSISGSGVPSITNGSGFVISVSNVPGQRFGTLMYSFNPIAVPWSPISTSYRCVAFPVQRFGDLSSGGTAGQCNGTLSIDFNQWYATHPGAMGAPYVPSSILYAQGWFRDPAAPKQTNLSNGLRFTLCN